jgi:hypothetical protein
MREQSSRSRRIDLKIASPISPGQRRSQRPSRSPGKVSPGGGQIWLRANPAGGRALRFPSKPLSENGESNVNTEPLPERICTLCFPAVRFNSEQYAIGLCGQGKTDIRSNWVVSARVKLDTHVTPE